MPQPPNPFTARHALLMGVLNVTPDSFSDGGLYLNPQAATQRGLEMISQGADILDLGAESSRPGSRSVSAKEQLHRLLPVLKELRRQTTTLISIDTRSAAVAAACLAEGANIINDISALRHDRAMLKLLSRADCRIILMHILGTPQTMQRHPVYRNVTSEIIAFFRKRIAVCAVAGIERQRLLIDPGIGFGKTLEHNLTLLRRLSAFRALKLPIVIGVSRKSFLGVLTDEREPARRVAASVAAGVLAVTQGAAVLRVHDVAEHAAALRVMKGVLDTKRD
ncbi:MAG: dihydropteroate synthase [Planctomycetota bacterium]